MLNQLYPHSPIRVHSIPHFGPHGRCTCPVRPGLAGWRCLVRFESFWIHKFWILGHHMYQVPLHINFFWVCLGVGMGWWLIFFWGLGFKHWMWMIHASCSSMPCQKMTSERDPKITARYLENDTCPQSDKWIHPSSRINPPINGFLSTWFKHEPYWSAPLMWTILVPCHLVWLMVLLASDSVI